jgi:hypothetical protein
VAAVSRGGPLVIVTTGVTGGVTSGGAGAGDDVTRVKTAFSQLGELAQPLPYLAVSVSPSSVTSRLVHSPKTQVDVGYGPPCAE